MSLAHKFAVKGGDETVKSAATLRDAEGMIYMGIVRIQAKDTTNQLRVSLAQLESVLAKFTDACPAEVRGSVSLMICSSDGGSWGASGPGGGERKYELAINGYRSPTKAEIAEMADKIAQTANEKHLMGMDYERSTYERLRAKFGGQAS